MRKLSILFLFLFLGLNALAQKNFVDQPYIETFGKADTLVIPDQIFLSILLSEADSKNKKSVEELEKALESVLKALNIDIDKKLSLFDISSDFKKYLMKGTTILKTKMYSLELADAVTVGKVLIELENAGISNVNIERTEYSGKEALILDLKQRAILKTKITAEHLAMPLHQKVGKAIYISDEISNLNNIPGAAPGISIRGMSSLYGSRAAEPMYTEFKKLKFEVTVRATYALD